MRKLLFLFIFVLCVMVSPAQAADTAPAEGSSANNPKVKMVTSKGELVIELYPDKAPVTVENFLAYVNAGFYHGTIFHRVIPGFVIQGGGFKPGMKRRNTQEPIINEADNGLKNLHYTLSMARTMDPHSATSQFFINLQDNKSLDYTEKSPRGWGYAVFGKVVQGMEVVDAIAGVQTGTTGRFQNVPSEDVLIESATPVE